MEVSWMKQCFQVLSNLEILNQVYLKETLTRRLPLRLLISFQLLEETPNMYSTRKVIPLINSWTQSLRAWSWKVATTSECHATTYQLSIQTLQTNAKEETSGLMRLKNKWVEISEVSRLILLTTSIEFILSYHIIFLKFKMKKFAKLKTAILRHGL